MNTRLEPRKGLVPMAHSHRTVPAMVVLSAKPSVGTPVSSLTEDHFNQLAVVHSASPTVPARLPVVAVSNRT